MGFIMSKFGLFSSGDYDTPDPATGITPRQKEIVENTWKIVRADTKNNGLKLFVKFFGQYPEYQKLFKGFSDVPLSEFFENKKVLAHAMSVMYAMNSIVDNLNDPDCLVAILKKVGTSHQPRGVSETHFKQLGLVIMDFIEEVLGSSLMDKTAKEAWCKTFEVATSIIVEALEDKD